jgi:hypothetical protein
VIPLASTDKAIDLLAATMKSVPKPALPARDTDDVPRQLGPASARTSKLGGEEIVGETAHLALDVGS